MCFNRSRADLSTVILGPSPAPHLTTRIKHSLNRTYCMHASNWFIFTAIRNPGLLIVWEGSPGTFSGATTGVGWSGKQDTNLCDAVTASCEPHSDSQQFVECWWEILDSLPLPVVISRTPTRHWQGPCLSWKVKASGVVEKQDTNMCDVITASCEPWLWVLIPNRKISRQAWLLFGLVSDSETSICQTEPKYQPILRRWKARYLCDAITASTCQA